MNRLDEISADQCTLLRRHILRFEGRHKLEGEKCCKKGMVVSRLAPGKKIVGVVGVEKSSHRVVWQFDGRDWWDKCTCKMRYGCRHSYAVALDMLAGLEPTEDQVEKTVRQMVGKQRMDAQIEKQLSKVRSGSYREIFLILKARNPWDAEGYLKDLLKRLYGFQPDKQWKAPPMIEEKNEAKRAWRLARYLLEFGTWLPDELEQFRHHERFEAEEQARVENRLVHHPVKASFTFVLKENGWLQCRLQAVSQKDPSLQWEWGAQDWEQKKEETEVMSSHDQPEEMDLQEKREDSETVFGEDPFAVPVPDPVWMNPLVEWLKGIGLQSAELSGFKGQPGWWTFVDSKRLEILAEEWLQRPRTAGYWGNSTFRNLMNPNRKWIPKIKMKSSGMDWFTLSTEWEEMLKTMTPEDWRRWLDSKETFVRLSDGSWVKREMGAEVDDLRSAMADMGLDMIHGEQRLSIWQLVGDGQKSLDRLEQMLLAGGDSETLEVIRSIRRNVENFNGIPDVSLPKRLRAELRPYQKNGLNFLVYAADVRLGVILADDMGLGKTLQALSWLEYLRDQRGPAPSLVVCPASVIGNWKREAERFIDQGKVLLLTRGAERHELRQQISNYDLVVTNYALLRWDLDELKKIEFRAVILDEAQNIKNPDSIVSCAAKELRSQYRLALTGTPLENRLLDLWSIADFVSPGYLGSRSSFVKNYDLSQEPQQRRLLSARLRPMLLRRLKKEVAVDLPDRIEECRECELTQEQKKLYLTELHQAREMVSGMKDADEFKKNKLHVLAALTRLRQICCHPNLVGGSDEMGSGKLDVLMEILEPLLEEGHKVLIFSQFVRMLHVLEHEFQKKEIPYHILTGSTIQRDEVVRKFQDDTRASVFLLSLKAGGTGLNLTSASYVILYDPWWNPAVEAQAIDRVHRIGQDRTVIAYRLIAKETVEEKIFKLQESKRAMMTDVLGTEGFAKSLSLDDMKALFHSQQDGLG